MERSVQKNALINLLALLAVGAAGFAAARYAHSLAGQVASFYLGLGVLVAAVSWFQLRLEERERLEKLEFDELARSKGAGTIFETQEAEMFPARRSREQFERFFVPAFTAVLFLLQAGGGVWLWRWIARSAVVPIERPLVAMALFALFGLTLFLLGKFAVTLARLENSRLLRPGAGYLLLGAYLCFAVAMAIAAVQARFPQADMTLARVLSGLLVVIAVETLVTLVLEIYRPRVKGQVARPIYESRLVGLLGQPEGLITTAAQALDYQFGFKVSETWFYRFLEKRLGWLLLLQLAVLLLSTCVVFIEPGEQALLERFGRVVPGRAVLGPGGHLKWPWPIDVARRFSTERVQSFAIGFSPEEEKTSKTVRDEKVVLWTVAHGKEENFLVAGREQIAPVTPSAAPEAAAARRSPPVSLLVVNIPVHFQITNLLAWAYNNKDAAGLLEKISTREVIRYLVSVDIQDLMTHGRQAAGALLRERIQQAADALGLGLRVVFVGLEGIHPPVKVAADYEAVISATHTNRAKILAAQADAIRTNALAGGRAYKAINDAKAESRRRETDAAGQAAQFTNQIPAFAAAPAVYTERAYLERFARAVTGARKYLLLSTNTTDVIQYDLQDKIRPDLLEGVTVTPPKTK